MSQNIPGTLAQGRYKVGALIGHGGMAEVHLGTDMRLGRQVAVKIMRSDLASDAVFLSRFRREAHSVAQLNNPNIVAIYDSGEEPIIAADGERENIPYIVMEYVKGQTLRDIIKENGALNQRDAAQIIVGVLNALEYSHRMGIIHRDIKPGNIMISDQGVVKVMDFGIARALDDSSTTMTQSQGVVGTAQYLSPEQARGETVDMRSDIYSAGCVLYEMLTGKPPFTGDSPVSIAYQHVSEVAVPPSTITPGLPKVWDSVIAKAMAKDRQNRYSTATEFKNDVIAVMNGGAVSAAGFNPLTDLASHDASATAATMPITSGEATQAFNPLTQAMGQPTKADVATATRAKQREAERQKRKKKNIIIWSIIGAIALIAIGWGIWALTGAGANAQEATVPTITQEMSETRAKEKIEAAGFIFRSAVDNNSDQPKGTFTKQSPAGGTKEPKGSVVTCWFSSGPASVTVPNVAGMSQSEARKALQSAGFVISATNIENSATVPKDDVTRTDPAAGTSQPKGTNIVLYVSSGQTAVPNVTGQSQAEAQKTLQDAGFSITVQQQSSSSVAQGNVIGTNPSAGTNVAQKSMITIYVSSGAEQVSVPSLTNQTISNAKSVLSSLGFSVTLSPSNASDNWTVSSVTGSDGTDLSSGGNANKGSTITLHGQPPANSNSNQQSNSNNSNSNSGGNNSNSGSSSSNSNSGNSNN